MDFRDVPLRLWEFLSTFHAKPAFRLEANKNMVAFNLYDLITMSVLVRLEDLELWLSAMF